MSIEVEIQEIATRIAQLARDAYKRGENDAIERLLRAAKSDPPQIDHEPEVVVAPPPKVARTPKKRAPRGSVGQLVDRALAGGGGMTPAEIKSLAVDERERMIAEPSIRAHLGLGHKDGRYSKSGGRWYSAKSATVETQKAADPAGGQTASDAWSNQEEHR